MKPTKTHTYKGRTIRPCECLGPYWWYIQSYHAPTGLPWEEDLCLHVWTLAEARVWIDEGIRYGA